MKKNGKKIQYFFIGILLFVHSGAVAQFTTASGVVPSAQNNFTPIIVGAQGVGSNSGVAISNGHSGIYIGKGSQASVQTGYNLAIGNAISYTSLNNLDQIPLASLSGTSTTSGSTMANFNIAIGSRALRTITTSSNNTAVGQQGPLWQLVTGDQNCAFGSGALSNLLYGTNNIGIGSGAQVQQQGTPGVFANNQLSIQNTIWGTNMGTANSSVGIAAQPVSHNGGPNFAKLYVGGNTGTSPSLQLLGVPTLANSGNLYLYVDAQGIVKQGTPNGTGTGIGSSCTTSGFVPRVTNSTGTGSLGCSQITDDGTNTVQIGTNSVGIVKFTTPSGAFSVYGPGATSSLPGQTIIAVNTPYKLFVQGWTASTGYVALSDMRMKKNIRRIENPLTRISKLKGYTYNWDKENFANKKLDDSRQVGFLAQEVEEVLPEAVVKNDDGVYGLNYNAIMPLLAEGIKEQQSQIETQQLEIENLKMELADLKNKLNQLTPGDVKLKVNSIEVVPNPITGISVVSYKLDNASAISILVISDLQGRLIKQINLAKNLSAGQVQVNKQDLPKGMYVFSIVSGNTEVQSKKVLVSE